MVDIKVIDAPCGYGKTEFAIQYMKKHNGDKKFIFVTPYLSEVDRVKNELPDFEVPTSTDEYNKSDHVKQLIENGDSIITTHELFKHFDAEMLGMIYHQEYTMILDEVMNVIDSLQLGKDALRTLIENKCITIHPDNHLIEWVDGASMLDINPSFTNAQKLIQKKSVYEVNGVGLVWTLPVSYFKPFDEIFILTYMFDYQLQAYYYEANDLDYDLYSVKPSEETKHLKYPNVDYELVKHKDRIVYDKKAISKLINIYDGKLNTLGQTKKHNLKDGIPFDGTLSSTWFEKAKESQIEALARGIVNYYTNVTKSTNIDRVWTCKKEYKSGRKSLVADLGDRIRKYGQFHIPLNLRGTNDYGDKFNIVYMTNVFMNPIESQYFTTVHNLEINENMWALSEMVQFIYRTRIRKGEQVNIWIPSVRMRELMKWWLGQNGI